MQKYTQLSQELRYQIYSFNKAGWTQCSIAKEIGVHQATISRELQCFFAHPYHSWERETNENTNGLIRQYFKKNMSLDNLTQKDTQYVMNQLNYRPRKVIGFCFPIDLFWRHVVQCWKDNLNYALAI
jgi:IS30 family transposase